MVCLQVMDPGNFTDLLLAAMSESGLTDLETYDDQSVADRGSLLAANAQAAVGTPATSQKLMPVSVQPPQIQTSSIVLQHPQLKTPLHPAVVPNSGDAAKGVHKIVIRPLPTGLQQSVSSRQLQPVVLQSTSNRPRRIPSGVSFGQPPVRPVLPVLQTAVPSTGSSVMIRSQTAPSVSVVGIPGTAIRPTLIPKTLRFTAVPRLAARLPSCEANVSLHIRPRLPASVILPQMTAPITDNIVQPRPALSQACMPLTTSNFATSGLFSTAAISVSSFSGSVSASVSQPVALTAAGHVSSAVDFVAAVSCISSVPTSSGMQVATSCLNADNANPLSVMSALSHREMSSIQSNMMLQADTHIDSCSTVVTSGFLSSDQMAKCVYTSTTVTVSSRTDVPSSTDVSSGIVCIATSSAHTDDAGSTSTLSENVTVTAANSEAVNTAIDHVGDFSTVNHSATEADDQPVRS